MRTEVVEVCPHCEAENSFDWDIEKNGYAAVCQRCGEKMMLCDECLHSEDNECGRCDWSEATGCFRDGDALIELCTFPDDDKDYCKWFIVPRDWLVDVLERMDAMNNREGVNLAVFLDNYVWDETYAIYEAAKVAGKIEDEGTQE